MTFVKGHGTAVAVVLSIIAVVAAGSGTAVAVSSAVNIADPTTPSRVAKVDAAGRLSTGGALATVNAAGYMTGYVDGGKTQVTSATTATLAISRVTLSNPSANSGSSEQQITLTRYPTDAGGTCVSTTSGTVVARYNVTPGDDVTDVFPAPVLIRPVGTAKYCLYLSTQYLDASAPSLGWYVVYGVSAYVVTGAYTGIGDGTSPPSAKAPASARTAR